MTIKETPQGYLVQFDYDYLKVKAVKEIPGSKWNNSTKTWTIPLDRTPEVNALKKKFHVLDDDIANRPEIWDDIPPLPDVHFDIALKREPFPYQRQGIARGLELKRLIIGDQPGLGKTGQSIGIVQGANAFPCIVVCPATLKENWKREWGLWTNRRAMVLNDRVKKTWQQYAKMGLVDVFIVNYESLKKYFVEGIYKEKDAPLRLNHIKFNANIDLFKSVIIDESHRCKDGSTQQSKFMMGLAKGKEYVLALTGTPVINKPKDLVSQLHIIQRLGDFGGYKHFMGRYCDGGSGANNLRELNYRLHTTCFFRREKKEVLKDLPDKMRQVLGCDITTRNEYTIAENHFVKYLKEIKGCTDAEIRRKLRGEVMVQMGILKNISARGKLNEVRDYVDEILDAGEKVILFVHLKEVAQALKAAYPHAGMIAGGVTHEQRQQAVDAFQTDPNMRVIICSIKAAGVGLTLTASSRVGFVEFPWTFADCEQCEDRAHRIGQHDSVQCTYFLGRNTIDEYCYELIQKKKTIAQAVTGGNDGIEDEFIDELMDLFTNKKTTNEPAAID
jgi:SWI/SNF-related matrix-associated actin-dependent regulator 1 of chromatin subfamily A